MHVLVVEDDALSRVMLEQILQRAGHSVTAVATGEDAIAAHVRRPADVIVMDLNLPGMNGEEAAEHMARDGGVPPVILLTGDPDRAQGASNHAAVTRVLQKPVDPAGLVALLEGLPRPG